MKRLNEMLEGAVGRPEMLRQSRAQRVMRLWREVVGEGIAVHCVPDKYDKGVLWLAASGSAWAQEIRLKKDELLLKLNEAAGEELFRDLRIGTRPPRREWLAER